MLRIENMQTKIEIIEFAGLGENNLCITTY